MGNCNNKIVNTCDGMKPLLCTEYDGTVNEDSSLVEESCFNGQEVVQDIYDQLENLNLAELGDLCLSYVQENNKNSVKNVLLKFEEKICEYEERIESLENASLLDMNITNSGIDFDCLEAPCDGSIVTLKDWMLAMQTKICEAP